MRKQKREATKRLAKREKFTINRGQYKGLGLFLESNDTTRPTKSLVKKSFFDTMQNTLFGKTFIECFAGSGQMGFEALSLGASNAVFFENNTSAFKNLCNNITLFWEKYMQYHSPKSQDSKHHKVSNYIQPSSIPFSIQAHFKDCLQSQDLIMNFSKNADFQVKNDIMANFEIISQTNNIILYMDPPFACRIGFENIYKKIWHFIESFNECLIQKVDIIVIESMSNANLDTQIGAFSLVKKSKFGQTTLMYFTKE